MEKTTVIKTSKYLSILVMILTGFITLIAMSKEWISTQEWGEIVLALSGFLLALRGYLKDHYGMI